MMRDGRTALYTGEDGCPRDDVDEARMKLTTLDRLVGLLQTAATSTGHSSWQGGFRSVINYCCLLSL